MGVICKSATSRLDQDEEEGGERRTAPERRRFSYTAYIPERRSGRDRRNTTEPECDMVKD
jgi:hypothetical protein